MAADMKGIFRLIQSIPSPKAEPFKMWMAQVASTRLEQMQDPEKSIVQAVMDYKRLGYSDAARNQLESKLGHKVISPAKASDYLPPSDDSKNIEE